MKRLRIAATLATLAVSLIGVEVVAACQSTITTYYATGRRHCYLVDEYDGRCYYQCEFYPIHYV